MSSLGYKRTFGGVDPNAHLAPERWLWFFKPKIPVESLGFWVSDASLGCMIQIFRIIFAQIGLSLRSRAKLNLESLALRHQIEILERTAPKLRGDS